MAADIFEKIKENRGPLGIHAKRSHGYFTFPKLEGETLKVATPAVGSLP